MPRGGGSSVVIVAFTRAWRAAACAIAVGFLAACAVVDHIEPRYENVNHAAANARNEGILLNIVRASKNIPLNFIAFSKVAGTTNIGMNAGLPKFGLGPEPLVFDVNRQAVFGSSVLGGSASAKNDFDITLLETKDFYSGLLSPVDLPTLNFFVRQGYSRELLFWLFTESVRETVGGRTFEYRNDPDPAIACETVRGQSRCFSNMVEVALATGLTVQTRTERASGAAKAVVLGRLCFDNVLAQRARRLYPAEIFTALQSSSGHRPRCSDPWPKERTDGGTDLLTFEVLGSPYGRMRYEITTRSTFGIYQFLGRVVATGAGERIRLYGRLDQNEDPRLLSVGSGGSGGCFVELGFDGGHYCIPRQGAENTKRIFSLLSQLLALRTLAGDLAITPTVRTVQ